MRLQYAAAWQKSICNESRTSTKSCRGASFLYASRLSSTLVASKYPRVAEPGQLVILQGLVEQDRAVHFGTAFSAIFL